MTTKGLVNDAGSAREPWPQLRSDLLLRLDPDLGNDLTPDVWGSLRESALVKLEDFPTGPWDPIAALAQGPRGTIALLVIDGLLIRELQIAGRTSAELFGAGDLIQLPPHGNDGLSEAAAWKALVPGSLALLDEHLLADAAAALSLLSALASRSIQRGRSLGMLALTRTMRRTDQRLVFLLSYLAARWGHMRPDGIRLTLPVSHETLARLIGTRRQSVSTALGELRARGLLRTLPNGDWLLPHQITHPQHIPVEHRPILEPERTVTLFDADRELALAVPHEQLPLARGRARVRLRSLPAGGWDAAGEYGHHVKWLGLLVIGGFLARRTRYRQETTLEVIGPGDLIRPWDDIDDWLPEVTTSWKVLGHCELALLDDQVMGRLAPWPGVTAEILGRAGRRARWLALRLAISQQKNLDDRLICLFAYLARRWGAGRDRLIVPMPLTHVQIAELAGAERPSVTGTLGDLRRQGMLERLPGGTWRVAPACFSRAEALGPSPTVVDRAAVPDRAPAADRATVPDRAPVAHRATMPDRAPVADRAPAADRTPGARVSRKLRAAPPTRGPAAPPARRPGL